MQGLQGRREHRLRQQMDGNQIFHPLPPGAAISPFSRSLSPSPLPRMYPDQKANYHFPVGVNPKEKKIPPPPHHQPHKAK